MPETVLGAFAPINPHTNHAISPILRISKPRLAEVKYFTQVTRLKLEDPEFKPCSVYSQNLCNSYHFHSPRSKQE